MDNLAIVNTFLEDLPETDSAYKKLDGCVCVGCPEACWELYRNPYVNDEISVYAKKKIEFGEMFLACFCHPKHMYIRVKRDLCGDAGMEEDEE